MEIIGDDKRLRALFSNVKSANEGATPSFTSVWHRAQADLLKPRRAFNLSLTAVTAMLALTLGSLAVWSVYSAGKGTHYQAFADLNAPNPNRASEITTPSKPTLAVESEGRWRPAKSGVMRSASPTIAARRKVKNSTPQVATLDTWQSPTAALLTSPAEGLFKSLPLLNENANELKSFLPSRANEKEK